MRRQSLNAPEGIVTVDEETQHTWRPVYVGRIRSDGQFDFVWSSEKPIRPIPYPRSRSRAEWDSFLENLNKAWGGWANPGTKREVKGKGSVSGSSRSGEKPGVRLVSASSWPDGPLQERSLGSLPFITRIRPFFVSFGCNQP